MKTALSDVSHVDKEIKKKENNLLEHRVIFACGKTNGSIIS